MVSTAVTKLSAHESWLRWIILALFIFSVVYSLLWWAWVPPLWLITIWSYVTYLAVVIALLQVLCFLSVPRLSVGRDLLSFFILYLVLLSCFSTWYYQLQADFAIPSLSDAAAAKSRLAEINRLQSEEWYKQAENDHRALIEFWKTLLGPANVATTIGPLHCPEVEVGGRRPAIDCLRIAKRNELLAEKTRLAADLERSNFLYVLYTVSGDVSSLSPQTPRARLLVIGQRVTLFFILTVYLTALTKRGRGNST